MAWISRFSLQPSDLRTGFAASSAALTWAASTRRRCSIVRVAYSRFAARALLRAAVLLATSTAAD